MTKAKKKLDDRFTREMTETAEGMRSVGVMDEAAYKLTMRDLNRAPPAETVAPLTGDDIKELRERANMSQAVFARFLHLTVDHVSKLERGAKRPTGPALVLLNIIRRKGIEAIM
jgi:putative transcriptional regulator